MLKILLQFSTHSYKHPLQYIAYSWLKRCTGIRKGRVRIPLKPEFFFITTFKSCLYNCDDLLLTPRHVTPHHAKLHYTTLRYVQYIMTYTTLHFFGNWMIFIIRC